MYPNRKERGMRLRRFFNDYIGLGLLGAVVIWIGGCIIALIVSSVRAHEMRTTIATQEFARTVMEGEPCSVGTELSAAEQLASRLHSVLSQEERAAILALFVQLGENDFGWLRRFSDNREDVANIARGEPCTPTHISTWGEFFRAIGTIGVPWLWSALVVGSFISLCFFLSQKRERFYDLPWHKPLMWCYAVLTFPLSTPFFCVSEIRWRPYEEQAARKREEDAKRADLLRLERERRAAEERARAAREAKELERAAARAEALRKEQERVVCESVGETQVRRIREARERLVQEVVIPADDERMVHYRVLWREHRGVRTPEVLARAAQSAAQLVKNLQQKLVTSGRRMQKLQKRLAVRQYALDGLSQGTVTRSSEELERLRHNAAVSVRGLQRGLKTLGKNIAQMQGRFAAALYRQRELEGTPTEIEEKIAARLDGEFDRLLALPSVLGVRITDTTIEVWTTPVIVNVQGRRFDLGSYRITINPAELFASPYEARKPKVHCVISAHHDGIRCHVYSRLAGGFCFGSRAQEMEAVMRQREFLPAIVLALEGLHHVNSNDENFVMLNYLEVRDADTVG